MSFKVICIDNGPHKNNAGKFSCAYELSENSIYTVSEISNVGGYIIKEVRNDENYAGYTPTRFIPLSTIDERELLEQRQTQLA